MVFQTATSVNRNILSGTTGKRLISQARISEFHNLPYSYTLDAVSTVEQTVKRMPVSDVQNGGQNIGIIINAGDEQKISISYG